MKQSISKYSYLYFVCTAIVATFLAVSLTHAQTEPTTPTDPAEINRMQAERMRTEGNAERRMMVASQVQDRIVNLASNATNRLKAGVARMAQIISRIESRIEKLKAEGVDTSVAETKLRDAKNALSAVEDTLAELGSVRDAVSSTDYRGAFAPIRTQFLATRDLLRQTHFLLQETVMLLREATLPQGVPSTNDTGTSTLSVE